MDYFRSIAPPEWKPVHVAASISALLGVEGKEALGAFASHFWIAYLNGGRGPSVMYNFVAGSKLRKAQYKYVLFPVVADLNYKDESNRTITAHAIAFALGFIAAEFKWV